MMEQNPSLLPTRRRKANNGGKKFFLREAEDDTGQGLILLEGPTNVETVLKSTLSDNEECNNGLNHILTKVGKEVWPIFKRVGWILTPHETRKGDATIMAAGYTLESAIEGVTKYDTYGALGRAFLKDGDEKIIERAENDPSNTTQFTRFEGKYTMNRPPQGYRNDVYSPADNRDVVVRAPHQPYSSSSNSESMFNTNIPDPDVKVVPELDPLLIQAGQRAWPIFKKEGWQSRPHKTILGETTFTAPGFTLKNSVEGVTKYSTYSALGKAFLQDGDREMLERAKWAKPKQVPPSRGTGYKAASKAIDESLSRPKPDNFYTFALRSDCTEWSKERSAEQIPERTEWTRGRSAERVSERSAQRTEWTRERSSERVPEQIAQRTEWSRERSVERVPERVADAIEWNRQRSLERDQERSRSAEQTKFRQSHLNANEDRDDWNEMHSQPETSRYTSQSKMNNFTGNTVWNETPSHLDTSRYASEEKPNNFTSNAGWNQASSHVETSRYTSQEKTTNFTSDAGWNETPFHPETPRYISQEKTNDFVNNAENLLVGAQEEELGILTENKSSTSASFQESHDSSSNNGCKDNQIEAITYSFSSVTTQRAAAQIRSNDIVADSSKEKQNQTSSQDKNNLYSRVETMEKIAYDDGRSRDGSLVSRIKDMEQFIFPSSYNPPKNLTFRVDALSEAVNMRRKKTHLSTRVEALEKIAFDDGQTRDGTLVSRIKELEEFIFPPDYVPPKNLTYRVDALAHEFEFS